MGKFRLRLLLTIMIIGVGMLAGCQQKDDEAAKKIVQQALKAKEKRADFYGEAIYRMGSARRSPVMDMKEYVSKNGDKKTIIDNKAAGMESTMLAADGKITLYEKKEKKAFIADLDEDDSNGLSARDEMLNMLEATKDTHIYKLKGEEELIGRNTDHIQLRKKKKSEQSPFDEADIWIDQKTSHPLKMKAKSNGEKVEMEYTKLDFKPEFKADTFKLDLPKDVKVEAFDDGSAGE